MEGWARYWAHVHDHLADRLAAHPALRAATAVVPFETLCRRPEWTLQGVFGHCGLLGREVLVERLAERVRFPDYYEPGFTEQERRTIERHTRGPAQRLSELADALADGGGTDTIGLHSNQDGEAIRWTRSIPDADGSSRPQRL